VGLVIGLAGVIALLGIDVAGHPEEFFGAICVLVATVGYATAPIIINRKLSTQHPLGPVSAGLVLATLVLAPVAALTTPSAAPSANAIASVVVLGVGCTALGLVLFFVLITEAGPSRASVITYVNPVVAVTLGVIFLDERLGPGSAVGLPLILVGSWLATMRARRAPRATQGELRPFA
jgi:drug/metabolite transporter (DMT)-like permease